MKLEEELQTSSAASFHRPSRDAAVSEAQAFDRNKDMMAFQMFLKPLRTSQDQFTDTEFDLLLPFLRLMDEPRSKEVRTEMHVLLRQPAGPARKKKLKDEDLYITNSIPNSRNPKKIVHDHLCGFDKYNKVHGAESVSQHQLDVAQHEATLGFDSSHSISHYDGWGSWAARIPLEVPRVVPRCPGQASSRRHVRKNMKGHASPFVSRVPSACSTAACLRTA